MTPCRIVFHPIRLSVCLSVHPLKGQKSKSLEMKT